MPHIFPIFLRKSFERKYANRPHKRHASSIPRMFRLYAHYIKMKLKVHSNRIRAFETEQKLHEQRIELHRRK